MLAKLKKKYPEIQYEILELEHIRQAAEVEGLEVEKFPALILNGEQITAGSIPPIQQLLSILNGEA